MIVKRVEFINKNKFSVRNQSLLFFSGYYEIIEFDKKSKTYAKYKINRFLDKKILIEKGKFNDLILEVDKYYPFDEVNLKISIKNLKNKRYLVDNLYNNVWDNEHDYNLFNPLPKIKKLKEKLVELSKFLEIDYKINLSKRTKDKYFR